MMVSITLVDVSQYVNLTTLSGIAGSLLITNTSPTAMFLQSSPTQPAADSVGVLCDVGEEVAVPNTSGNYVWAKVSRASVVVVQSLTTASAEYSQVNFPPSMLTSDKEGYQRLRVDVAQTSFFTGRQFRIVKELSLVSGASYTLKFDRTVDCVIMVVDLAIDAGSVRMDVYRNSTPAGSWSENLTPIPINDMIARPTPYYTSNATLTAGGTISGGTLRDTIRVVTASATAQQSTVGGSGFGERGVAANTTGYYKFTNFGTGTATGVFHIAWEERP